VPSGGVRVTKLKAEPPKPCAQSRMWTSAVRTPEKKAVRIAESTLRTHCVGSGRPHPHPSGLAAADGMGDVDGDAGDASAEGGVATAVGSVDDGIVGEEASCTAPCPDAREAAEGAARPSTRDDGATSACCGAAGRLRASAAMASARNPARARDHRCDAWTIRLGGEPSGRGLAMDDGRGHPAPLRFEGTVELGAGGAAFPSNIGVTAACGAVVTPDRMDGEDMEDLVPRGAT